MKNWLFLLIICVIGGLLYKFLEKDSLIGVIYSVLPPRESGVLSAMIWGDKTGLDKKFVNDLRSSGLIHLFVVSGTNVMIIAKISVENLAYVLGRKKAIVLGMCLVWAYAAMVGFEAPIIRAVLFITLYYWSQILGRKFSVSRGLILFMVLMLMADIKIFTEISFWLSISAFLGILTLPQIRIGHFWLKDGWLALWISLWVTPILAFFFGEISLIGPITNALVLFGVSFVILVGGLSSLVGVLVPVLGVAGFYLIYPLVRYLIWIVDNWGGWDWVSVEVKFNWLMIIGWYLLLFWFINKTNES